MIGSFLTKVFGSKNERDLKKLQPTVDQINALESDVRGLTDDQLRQQTDKLKQRFNNGETLEPHGLFLVDSFGNRIHLYDDPKIGCLDPMPLKPRQRPPIIPTQTRQAIADREEGEPKPTMGTVSVLNIYHSRLPWPDDTKIKELRIISLFPKSNLLNLC